MLPLSAPFVSGIISAPYRLSYKLTHLAFAALRRNLALETGQTNCGPQILEISLSTFLVCILKFGPFFFYISYFLQKFFVFFFIKFLNPSREMVAINRFLYFMSFLY